MRTTAIENLLKTIVKEIDASECNNTLRNLSVKAEILLDRTSNRADSVIKEFVNGH